MPKSFPDQITMEKTPRYWICENGPEMIYKMNPNVKLILIFRDPVSRVVSDFYHTRAGHPEIISKKTTFEPYITKKNGSIDLTSPIIIPSYYDIHMKRWLDVFPPSQILIVDQRDLSKLKLEVFSTIEDFLGISHEMNATKLSQGKGNSVCINMHEVFGGKKCSQNKVHHRQSHNEAVMKQLQNVLKPHAQRFYDIVGKDFGWTFVE